MELQCPDSVLIPVYSICKYLQVSCVVCESLRMNPAVAGYSVNAPDHLV